MMPKAVPAAPLGLWAKQCYADADVEAAAAIVAPTNNATRKRPMIALPLFYELRYCQRSAGFLLTLSIRDGGRLI